VLRDVKKSRPTIKLKQRFVSFLYKELVLPRDVLVPYVRVLNCMSAHPSQIRNELF